MLSNNYLKNDMKLKQVAFFLFCCAILTSSFDIFLVAQISNFTVRIAQIFIIILILTFSLYVASIKKLIIPICFIYLFIWIMFIFAFSFNSYDVFYNLGYFLFLVFNVLMIITVVNLFNNYSIFKKLYVFYLKSFYYIALFGILEFILGIAHIKIPLITQWWIEGVLPRINGFSYEPSFYATYLIMGWVMTAYLRKHNSKIINHKKLKWIFYIETLSLILCSSRMGWLMMIIWYLQFPLKVILGSVKGKIRKKDVKILVCAFLFVICFSAFIIKNYNQLDLFLSGTGLGGTSAHSVSYRNSAFLDTIEVFKNNPIQGVGLGGVNLEVAKLNGEFSERHSDITGSCVFAEVLAASGIFGFLFFIIYILKLIYKPLKVARQIKIFEDSKIIRSLVIAFIFELIILQFNQNILRLYFWIHIAILSAAYFNINNTNKLYD